MSRSRGSINADHTISLGELLDSQAKIGEDRVSLPFSSISTIGSIAQTWKSTIRTLLLAHNSIVHLDGLRQFRFLQKLSLAHNRILSLEELKHVPDSVENLTLEGNPIDVLADYRTSVVLLLPNLRVLDNKAIREEERNCAMHDKIGTEAYEPFLFRRAWDSFLVQHAVQKVQLHMEMVSVGVIVERCMVLEDLSAKRETKSENTGLSERQAVFPGLMQLAVEHMETTLRFFDSKAETVLPKDVTAVVESFPESMYGYDDFRGSDDGFASSHPVASMFFDTWRFSDSGLPGLLKPRSLKHGGLETSAEGRASQRMFSISAVFREILHDCQRLHEVLSQYVDLRGKRRAFTWFGRQSGVFDSGLCQLLEDKSFKLRTLAAENKDIKSLIVSGVPARDRKATTTVQFEDSLVVAKKKYAAELVGQRAKKKFSEELQRSVKKFYSRRMLRLMKLSFGTWTKVHICVSHYHERLQGTVFQSWRTLVAHQKRKDAELVAQVKQTNVKKLASRLWNEWRRLAKIRQRELATLEQTFKTRILETSFEKWRNAMRWTKRMKDVLARAADRQTQRVLDSVASVLPNSTSTESAPLARSSSALGLKAHKQSTSPQSPRSPERTLDALPRPFQATPAPRTNDLEFKVLREWDDYCEELGTRITRTVSERILKTPAAEKKKSKTGKSSSPAKLSNRSASTKSLIKKTASSSRLSPARKSATFSKLVVVRK